MPLQIETKNGELYRGELYEAEDNWNCQMRAVQMTGRVCSLKCPCRNGTYYDCLHLPNNIIPQYLRPRYVVLTASPACLFANALY